MEGVLIINKPKDFSSHDVVNVLRKELNTKKVGHTGTLDPKATGVLPILIGNAIEFATSNMLYAIVALAFLVPAEKFVKFWERKRKNRV